jgi:hypothetical protein
MTAPMERRSWQIGRGLTLIVTNAVKVGGLLVVLNEAFNKPQPRTVDIAVAAFMMAGAQISEEAILNLVSRMFGGTEHGEPREKGRK